MHQIIKKYLQSLEVIIEPKNYEELESKDIAELNVFHAEEVYMLIEDDDYFLDMRANHFAVEEGTSEFHKGRLFLVSANHKGIRLQTLLIDRFYKH